MASIPSATVEIAFDGGPFSSAYTWTDISDWVTGFQVRRGRNNELDRIEAGTLSLSLDNADGRFTPGRRKFGRNVFADSQGPYTVNLSGRADNTSVHMIALGSLDDDQRVRFVSRGVYTNGPAVSCYFAIRWKDAGGTTLRYQLGTRFVADGSRAVYTHEEAPPAGTRSADVWVWADTYPDGNADVQLTLDSAEWYQTAPYWPNVVPRRRVRVRTANLTPADVSTGGDISRTPAQFSTAHSAGTRASWASFPKSGLGAVRVDLGNNGTADFASSVRCGWASGTTPVGLAKVVPGRAYSVRSHIRQGESSPQLSVKQLVRWYDVNGAVVGTSSSTAAVPLLSARWVPLAQTGVIAPAGAVWAGVSIGSAGGDGGGSGYFFVDEVQLEQGPSLSDWYPGGSIFHGYIEKWPVTTEGLTAEVEVSAVDGFSVLSNTDLQTAFQGQILTTNPLGYWTLGDPVGSIRAENLADDQQPAALVASKYGGGTAQFGADSIVRNDSETSFSLTNIASNQGTVVDICENGKRNYPLGFELSVSFWCQPVYPSSGQASTLFRSWADTGADGLKVQLNSSGRLTATMQFVEGVSSVTSVTAVSSSAPTFVVITVKNGLTSIWLNGSLNVRSSLGFVTNNDVRDMRWASLGGAQAGSIYAEYANGRYAHLALWDRELSASEVADMWKVGDFGGADFTEDENSRITRIATMANFQGDTSYDAPKSVLQKPEWSTGARALDELQESAEDASGYIFMDGDGRLTYHNRDRRQGAGVRFVLGNSLPYESGLQFEMDEDRIINEVTYKRTNGIDGTVKDRASIASYGRKSKSIELRVTSDSSVQDAAYTLLHRYSDPTVRCDSVTLRATAVPALFVVALGVEIGDRITLADLPSQAPASSLDYYVEAIQTDVSLDGPVPDWVTTLSLSPAEGSDVWILEDGTLGRLDRTTVLAY